MKIVTYGTQPSFTASTMKIPIPIDKLQTMTAPKGAIYEIKLSTSQLTPEKASEAIEKLRTEMKEKFGIDLIYAEATEKQHKPNYSRKPIHMGCTTSLPTNNSIHNWNNTAWSISMANNNSNTAMGMVPTNNRSSTIPIRTSNRKPNITINRENKKKGGILNDTNNNSRSRHKSQKRIPINQRSSWSRKHRKHNNHLC